MPPVFFEPFDKTLTEEKPKHATNERTDQYRITREKPWFVEYEYARTKAESAADKATQQYSRDDVADVVFFVGHVLSLIHI